MKPFQFQQTFWNAFSKMDSIIFMDKFRLNLRDIAFLKLKNIYNYCLAFLKRKWINKHFEPNYWSSLLRNHSITHIIQIHTNMIIKIHKYIYFLICFFLVSKLIYLNLYQWQILQRNWVRMFRTCLLELGCKWWSRGLSYETKLWM